MKEAKKERAEGKGNSLLFGVFMTAWLCAGTMTLSWAGRVTMTVDGDDNGESASTVG